MKRSLFITLEGGEGAGKSTLLKALERDLLSKGRQVVTTREPGGSLLGEKIRLWLLGHDVQFLIHQKAELLLFLAARAEHLEEVIKPSLAAGKIVICDRFNDSTVAYQGVARGLGLEKVQHLCDLICEGIVPDLTFFLDVDPNVGLKRALDSHKENANAGEFDRIESEKLEFHKRVREGMLELAKRYPERIFVIDASQSPEAVFQAAVRRLEAINL